MDLYDLYKKMFFYYPIFAFFIYVIYSSKTKYPHNNKNIKFRKRSVCYEKENQSVGNSYSVGDVFAGNSRFC